VRYDRSVPPNPDKLRAELEEIPRAERLDYLAALPADRLAAFKRVLSPGEVRKLNQHIDRATRRRAEPTYESWLAEARAGRATSPDAMVEVLRERAERLRPQDALWIDRIATTASAGSYSKKQAAVIRGIYERYFGGGGAS
jgi:hypothetical protein